MTTDLPLLNRNRNETEDEKYWRENWSVEAMERKRHDRERRCQNEDDDSDIDWPVLEQWCHHNPVCQSMYYHNMLMVSEASIITMEKMAMEALNKGRNPNHIEKQRSEISSKKLKQNKKSAEKHRQKDVRSRMPQNRQRQK